MTPADTYAVIIDARGCTETCERCTTTSAFWRSEALDQPGTVERVPGGVPLGHAVVRAMSTHDAVLVQVCAARVGDAQARALVQALFDAPRLTAAVAPLLVDGTDLLLPLPRPSGGWVRMPRHARTHLVAPASLELAEAPVMVLTSAPIWASGAVSDLTPEASFDELLAAARSRGYRLSVDHEVVVPITMAATVRPYAEMAGDSAELRTLRRARLEGDLVGAAHRARASSVKESHCPRVLVDARGIPDHFNGTQQLAMALLDQLIVQNPRIHALVTPDALRFHALDVRWGAQAVTQADWTGRYEHAFKIDQPWSWTDWELLHAAAPTVSAYFLDVIAWDTSPPSRALGDVWECLAQTADAIAFLSEASRRNFVDAFHPRDDVLQEVIYPSLQPAEYLRPGGPALPTPRDIDVLVVGNGLPHKDLEWAVDFVRSAFPSLTIDAVGQRKGLAGRRPNSEVSTLYSRARIVLYPSHYEGFGLPIMEALGHGARVVVRDTDVNTELADRLGTPLWQTFSTTEELIAAIKEPFTSPGEPDSDLHDWQSAGRQLNAFFTQASTRFDLPRWTARENQVRIHG